MSFKKWLAMIGLITIVAPISNTVISCNNSQINDENFKIIKIVDKISDLEILTTSKEENETVFNVFQHTTLGLAAVIFQHKSINKNFKKELFKLDTENVYFDKERFKRVKPEEKIRINTTYYFQYLYKDKKNKVLVPVTIRQDNKTTINDLKEKKKEELNTYKGSLIKEQKTDLINNISDYSIKIANFLNKERFFLFLKVRTDVKSLQEIVSNGNWIIKETRFPFIKEHFKPENYSLQKIIFQNKELSDDVLKMYSHKSINVALNCMYFNFNVMITLKIYFI